MLYYAENRAIICPLSIKCLNEFRICQLTYVGYMYLHYGQHISAWEMWTTIVQYPWILNNWLIKINVLRITIPTTVTYVYFPTLYVVGYWSFSFRLFHPGCYPFPCFLGKTVRFCALPARGLLPSLCVSVRVSVRPSVCRSVCLLTT